jgi:hypothetical protein
MHVGGAGPRASRLFLALPNGCLTLVRGEL